MPFLMFENLQQRAGSGQPDHDPAAIDPDQVTVATIASQIGSNLVRWRRECDALGLSQWATIASVVSVRPACFYVLLIS